MQTSRSHLVIAGALLLATAAAGVMARGAGGAATAPGTRTAQFSAAGGGPIRFSGTLDRTAVLLGDDGVARIELTLAADADEAAARARRPTDLVVIFDRSGSMSGEKIEHARAAVRELMNQLAREDRFALVTYSDDAEVRLPLTVADDAQRSAWLAALGSIDASGGTNMASGLERGLALVESARSPGRVPHVILISDGLANQGDATPDGLMRRARRAAQGEFMLSSVGVGADFNEYLMTAIADAGTGNYYYVHDPRELSTVFAREFGAARTTVASGLAIEVAPGPGVRVVDAAGYPLEYAGNTVVLRPGSLFAGQERRIWLTLAVPQQAVGDYALGNFSLSYAGAGGERQRLSFSDEPRVACVASQDQFIANVDVPAWTRSVVVDAYNEMQEEVARAVKDGRREDALKRVRQFRDQTATMNQHLNSAPVAQQLHVAEKLEADVAGAFEGPNQAGKQNSLSKAASAEAVESRRLGAKMQ